MSLSSTNTISIGDYIVVQRWNFMKIIHFGGNKGQDFDVVLGNDIVNIAKAAGKPYWSTFKLIPDTSVKKAKKRLYNVEVCDGVENSNLNAELIKNITSGVDNRDINDDGKSQTLSTENIDEMRDSGTSADVIVGQLIENSTTFQKKTEYAQEKYLSKKKRKYFDYILLRPTSLRLMIEINNKKDTSKFLGITTDTLSQMITSCNIQPGGTYLTYENGCSGIISAMMLNYLDTTGKVLQIHPGPYPQKSSVLSLNLPQEKLACYLTASVKDMIEVFKAISAKNCDNDGNNVTNGGIDTSPVPSDSNMSTENTNSFENSSLANKIENFEIDDEIKEGNSPVPEDSSNGKVSLKRKNSIVESESNKRSCYVFNPVLKSEIQTLLLNKVDGLVIACKEHPNNILIDLLKYVAPSRPVIVYSLFREPLVDLFLELKTSKYPLINIRLTESFLRSYQVLPERTHPHMSMNSSSGFLLTATVIQK